MDKLKRNERIAVMARIVSGSPNRIFTLSHFCAMFDTAKSTISEDIEVLRKTFQQFGLGEMESVAGAAGGVRFLPRVSQRQALNDVRSLCARLSDASRVLPGGFLYMGDILSDPVVMQSMGNIMATPFFGETIDFVLTVETKGIPFALMTARALGAPLVIARRDHEADEGSVVTIKYMSGSNAMRTMSLALRSVQRGQRCLVVDDFMKGGGTVCGMMDLMREFGVQVAGAGVMIEKPADRRRMPPVHALMLADEVDYASSTVWITPAPWLSQGQS